jgi:hypothetical protein
MMPSSKPPEMAMYRHGDVLVRRVECIPSNALERPHLVLAEGEVTGHAHRIAEAHSAELYQDGARMYLRVLTDTATLIHQEHGPISLPRGDHQVWRQREYSPGDIRTIRD